MTANILLGILIIAIGAFPQAVSVDIKYRLQTHPVAANTGNV